MQWSYRIEANGVVLTVDCYVDCYVLHFCYVLQMYFRKAGIDCYVLQRHRTNLGGSVVICCRDIEKSWG